MIHAPLAPLTSATRFVRMIVLAVSFGVLIVFAGAQPTERTHDSPGASAPGATVPVTSPLGEFAGEAAGVPGWVISFASGQTSAGALGAGALPTPFDPLRQIFSEQPPVNLSGTTTSANASGGAIAASMPVAAPPMIRHAARPAAESEGHPIWVAVRPEVRPG